MGAVARLIVDPAGAALARTLSYPVQRDWPERERRAVRQDERPPGGGWGRSVSRPHLSRPSGLLRLMLSLADRQWVAGKRAYLNGGYTVRVQFDSTDAATYADVVVSGSEVIERYARIDARLDTAWMLDLPVVALSEVG